MNSVDKRDGPVRSGTCLLDVLPAELATRVDAVHYASPGKSAVPEGAFQLLVQHLLHLHETEVGALHAEVAKLQGKGATDTCPTSSRFGASKVSCSGFDDPDPSVVERQAARPSVYSLDDQYQCTSSAATSMDTSMDFISEDKSEPGGKVMKHSSPRIQQSPRTLGDHGPRRNSSNARRKTWTMGQASPARLSERISSTISVGLSRVSLRGRRMISIDSNVSRDESPDTSGSQLGANSAAPEWMEAAVSKRQSLQRNRSTAFNAFLVAKSGQSADVPESLSFIRLRAYNLSRTQGFDMFCSLAIIANSFAIGFELHTSATEKHHFTRNDSFEGVLARVFTLWFLVELMIRWLADGLCGFFCRSQNNTWNCFDLFIVSLDVLGRVQEFSAVGVDFPISVTVMRMLRLIRICRALRVIRLVGFFHELRIMIKSLLRSGRSLLWSVVLLAIVIYIFSIYFLQVIVQFVEDGNQDGWVLVTHSNMDGLLQVSDGVPAMFLTLYMAMAGGIDWKEFTDLLIEISWVHVVVMVIFIFFTLFVLLNVITGIFLDVALSSAREDKDELISDFIKSENNTMERLEHVFRQADCEGQGMLSKKQFLTLLGDQNTRALLASVGMEIYRMHGIFELMDTDESGTVTEEEFLMGCMRLKGGAKEVDLISLMYDNRKIHSAIRSLATRVGQSSETMQKKIDLIATLSGGHALTPSGTSHCGGSLASAGGSPTSNLMTTTRPERLDPTPSNHIAQRMRSESQESTADNCSPQMAKPESQEPTADSLVDL